MEQLQKSCARQMTGGRGEDRGIVRYKELTRGVGRTERPGWGREHVSLEYNSVLL